MRTFSAFFYFFIYFALVIKLMNICRTGENRANINKYNDATVVKSLCQARKVSGHVKCAPGIDFLL